MEGWRSPYRVGMGNEQPRKVGSLGARRSVKSTVVPKVLLKSSIVPIVFFSKNRTKSDGS